MNQSQDSPPDFERAQFDDPSTVAILCRLCQVAPAGSYFSLNGQTLCPPCLERVHAAQKRSSFLKALALGIAAGAVGAVIYYGIRLATGYDLALITVVLGSIVGVAVRRGAGGSQSVVYRLMAVGLAWTAMSSTYIPLLAPMLAESVAEAGKSDAAGDPASGLDPADRETAGLVTQVVVWGASAVLSLAIPFLFVTEMEILGLIIFGVGLWEAWRRSAAPPFVVTGPFAVPAA